jgi:hypothetical protein
MLKAEIPKVNAGIVLGMVFKGVAGYLRFNPQILGTKDTGIAIPWVLFAIGLACFVYGCVHYAAAKGHDRLLGSLGVLSVFGMIVLVCLPDKYPDGRKTDEPGVPPDNMQRRR